MSKINYIDFGYSLIKQEEIEELKYVNASNDDDKDKCNAYELVHNKSKAKILYLENNDPEMSFCIGFRTPPKDNTGVFHILEHSVLCGSRKYHTKEPFTDLLKSSMQTFLNAMTFDDKTMYPVASTNEKDLYNLINVYMDAVFFPNLYKNKNIFYQEGGHKTVNNVNNKFALDFNGVVYNEMKGVYSDPESVMFTHLQSNLLPDTCYAYSSGGIPEDIKKLEYTEFLKEHSRHYRLDNSYIIIYGNLDFNKMLKFLDIEYLSKWEDIIEWRKTNISDNNDLFPRTIEQNNNTNSNLVRYKMDIPKENSIFGCAYKVDKDLTKTLAIKAILDGIADSNDSPLKKLLLKENLGDEIDIDLFAEINEPFVYVEIKGIKENKIDNAQIIIEKCIKTLLKNSSYLEHISASIDNLEYKLKENNANYSTGIDYSISIMSEWLYQDKINTEVLKYNKYIKDLKSKLLTDYYEKLIKSVFISNKKTSCVAIVGDNISKSCKYTYVNKNEAIKIQQNCKQLEDSQNRPDSKEDLDTIPVMQISDIGKIKEYPIPNKIKNSKIDIYKYDINTNGIIYFNQYYRCNHVGYKDIPYLKILCLLLGNLETKNYNSEEIAIITKKYFGSLDIDINPYGDHTDIDKYNLMLKISCSLLNKNISYLNSFIEEIINNTKFDNLDKIKTIILQYKIELEENFVQMGHLSSVRRCLSNILPVSLIEDSCEGINFYLFLKKLITNFDKDKCTLIKKLQEIYQSIFKYNPIITYAGQDSCFNEIIENFKYKEKYIVNAQTRLPKLNRQNEVIIIPSMVNYVAKCSDMRIVENASFKASQIVASKISTYQYLWNEVRVKNGAYGCGLNITNKGTLMFYSFRDPNHKSTIETYNNFPNWLKNNTVSNEELKNYIISCVASIDSPKNIKDMIKIIDTKIICNEEFSMRSQIRQQIINTKQDDLTKDANAIKNALNNSVTCIFGNNDAAKENKSFNTIDIFNE